MYVYTYVYNNYVYVIYKYKEVCWEDKAKATKPKLYSPYRTDSYKPTTEHQKRLDVI